jgi:RNA polymerase sigma factor (sigma-70 family)
VASAFDAEEIAHDAFSAFFKQCLSGGFDFERPVRPYLLRIASNSALRRGRKGAREVLLDVLPPNDATVEPRDAELKDLLATCYADLSQQDQAVFDACFVEELSQAKAGAKLDRSRDQVYRSLTRIRQRALRFFKKKGWLDDA